MNSFSELLELKIHKYKTSSMIKNCEGMAEQNDKKR